MNPKIVIKSSSVAKNIKNFGIFCDKNFNIFNLNGLEIKKYSSEINQTIKNISTAAKDKKKFLNLNINPSQNIILIKTDTLNVNYENEKLGADFYDFLKANLINKISFSSDNFKYCTKKK